MKTMRIVCVFLICFSFLFSEEKKLGKPTVFSELTSVSVIPVVVGADIDKAKVEQVIVNTLGTFGTVKPGGPENFGKGNNVLKIMVGPIAIGNQTPASYAPIVAISMQLLTDTEVTANKNYHLLGLVWEEQSFVYMNPKSLDEDLKKAIGEMVLKLKKNYSEASTQPSFFITKNLF